MTIATVEYAGDLVIIQCILYVFLFSKIFRQIYLILS